MSRVFVGCARLLHKIVVLFVSHLTNSRQILQDNDAYFGDIPNQLLQNGISNSVVLINHAKVSKKQVLEGWSDSNIQRFILSSSLDFISEVSAYFSQLKSKRQLKSILKGLQIDEVLAQDILNNQLSSNTFNALRVAKQVELPNHEHHRVLCSLHERFRQSR